MYELIIIGAGPAGMKAAVYTARKKLNSLLLSKNLGVQVLTTLGVENYKGYQFIEGQELSRWSSSPIPSWRWGQGGASGAPVSVKAGLKLKRRF